MATTTNLTGPWRGEYSFDPDNHRPKLPALPIPFVMQLKQLWFGFVTGTAQDDPKRGMPELAKITGRFKNNELVLTKAHPIIRLVHEGKFDSTQQLADRFGVALDDFPPAHPKIHCAAPPPGDGGGGQSFSGDWMPPPGEIHVPGARSIEPPRLTGT